MKVRDTITEQRLNVDEAYERFFDGFYNLGKPAEIFERTVVMSPPRDVSGGARPVPRPRRLGKARRTGRRPAGCK